MRRAIRASASLTIPAFEFVLDGWEYFPRSKVLVAVPGSPTHPLFNLHRALHDALLAADFRLDKRPFRPHLTLFRDCKPPRTISVAPVVWHARHLALIESCATSSGVSYRPRWLNPLSVSRAQPMP